LQKNIEIRHTTYKCTQHENYVQSRHAGTENVILFTASISKKLHQRVDQDTTYSIFPRIHTDTLFGTAEFLKIINTSSHTCTSTNAHLVILSTQYNKLEKGVLSNAVHIL